MPSSIEPGRYRHFKGGEYEVLDTARHSETEEVFVVYRSMKDPAQLWIRPFAMFVESVEVEGELVPRFKRL